jgi:hypothetical protein
MSESSYTQPSIYSGYENSVQYIPQNTIYTVQPNNQQINPNINCDYCHNIGATYYYFPMCLKYHSFHPNCFSHITSTTPPSFCWKCTTDASRQVMAQQIMNQQAVPIPINPPSLPIEIEPGTANTNQIVLSSEINPSSRVKRILTRSCIIFSVSSIVIFIILYFTNIDRN